MTDTASLRTVTNRRVRPRRDLARQLGAPLLLALAGCSVAAAATGLTVDWHTSDGGGGVSTGAGYEVAGTIGQADAGASAAAGYAIRGGYWAGVQAAPAVAGNTLFQDGFE